MTKNAINKQIVQQFCILRNRKNKNKRHARDIVEIFEKSLFCLDVVNLWDFKVIQYKASHCLWDFKGKNIYSVGEIFGGGKRYICRGHLVFI